MKLKAVSLCLDMILMFKPPKRISVKEWADENRVLTSVSSAEPGKWRSERTPYMIPIMDAFTNPHVSHIYVMAGAQVGKSELINNCFGYVVDVDPGPVLWVHPTVESAEDYSKQRLDGMIRDTDALKKRIAPEKSRNRNNTILKKAFTGGYLAMVGANAPAGLRSRPIRYLLGDEVDAWAFSAGKEGDPEKLAERRTQNFFNRKILMVSTPTVKGISKIERGFLSGTQEEWRLPCPNCGEYHYIEFKDVIFESEKHKKRNVVSYEITSVVWRCPDCAFTFTEQEMKRQQGKMVTCNEHPKQGVRSFRLNAFISPWTPWASIVQEFLAAGKDPLLLQVVYNTLFGECFEDRGELEDADTLLARREEYPAELPEGVLVLTCAVDTQDDRLEYEVLGHGHRGENWGIRYGVIPGDPVFIDVWERLDEIIDKTYYFANGKGLRLSMTFVDSGGHRTGYVYEACRVRFHKHVFAIKGMNQDNAPLVGKPKKIEYVAPTAGNTKKVQKCWYYPLGVSAGKSHIMAALKVQEPGVKYCHFPGDGQGYTASYFDGLLSETLVYRRIGGQNKAKWEVLPGHRRNEPLDLRNYNLAAFASMAVDLFEIENRLKGIAPVVEAPAVKKTRKKRSEENDW